MVLDGRVVRRAASVLQQRRVATTGRTTPRDWKVAFAEASVMGLYDIELHEDDLRRLRKSLFVLPDDEGGRTMRVVSRDFAPMRVYTRLLDAEVVVFVETPSDDVRILGWLPRWRIEQAPAGEFNGDVYYEVEERSFEPMPSTFNFVETCSHVDVGEHVGGFGGIWSSRHNGWECCRCGRLIYDRAYTEQRERLFHGQRDFLST